LLVEFWWHGKGGWENAEKESRFDCEVFYGWKGGFNSLLSCESVIHHLFISLFFIWIWLIRSMVLQEGPFYCGCLLGGPKILTCDYLNCLILWSVRRQSIAIFSHMIFFILLTDPVFFGHYVSFCGRDVICDFMAKH